MRKSTLAVATLAVAFSSVILRLPHYAASQALLSRGPYLQNSSESSMTLVWQTASATTPELRVSRFPGPPWEILKAGSTGTSHEIELTGLQPDTEYFYEIGEGDSVLATGPGHRFRTHPAENSPRPFRFMAFGDCGTGDSYQWDLASQIDELEPRADFALLLGDLIYPSGEWENFDPNYFDPYRLSLRNQVWWPTLGNHDIGTQNGAAYIANFTLPTDSGASASPSGTERYYSFDYGMAHFVSLDFWSSGVSQDAGGAQYNWFVDDLDDAVARGKRWIIVFGHSPPYTKGSHDSDTEGNLINVRQVWVPVMESHGVDLYLAGHSHVYERSFLAKNDVAVQNDGNTYTKIGTNDGTIYIVGGAGGKKSNSSLDHPLMAEAVGGVNGFVVLDVTNEELRGSYEREDGTATDLFSVHKELDTAAPRIEQVIAQGSSNEVTVIFDEPVRAGNGVGGAENPNAYSIGGGVSVVSAELDSDGRRAHLSVSALNAGSSYRVTVNGVQDRATPANEIAPNSRGFFVGPDDSGTGIAQGASWRYFKGTSFPGATWMDPEFNDAAWPTGPAGFGFGDGDDATTLGDMSGSYSSVYVRRNFSVNDASSVHSLLLKISYDDGYVAFLNGEEVSRVNVPEGQTHSTDASAGHEASGFQTFDISGFASLLVDGTNTLAVEGHNEGVWNSDFSLHPTLEALGDIPLGNQPPSAVLRADRTTANAPATVRLSASRSEDPDGDISSYFWDFGDGTSSATGEVVEHEYSAPGVYLATLMVADDSGAAAVAQREIFLHDIGQNPTASISSSAVEIDPGETINFAVTAPSDPDGGPVSLLWDFDDPDSGPANLSLSTTPTHRFQSSGSYDISLTVTDDEGAQTAYFLNVGVGEPATGGGDGGGDSGGGGETGTDPGDGGGSVDPGAGLTDDDSGGGVGCGSIAANGGPPPTDGSFMLVLAALFWGLARHGTRAKSAAPR